MHFAPTCFALIWLLVRVIFQGINEIMLNRLGALFDVNNVVVLAVITSATISSDDVLAPGVLRFLDKTNAYYIAYRLTSTVRRGLLMKTSFLAALKLMDGP
jgi:hypothetical protein